MSDEKPSDKSDLVPFISGGLSTASSGLVQRGLHALAKSHFHLGETFYNARNFEGAMAEFRETISLNPDWPEARCALGTVLYLNGNYDDAIVELSKAISLRPDYAIAHCNLGKTFYEKGNREEAIAEFHEAICIDPKQVELHCFLGKALWVQGDLAGAKAELQEAIRLQPDSDMAKLLLLVTEAEISARSKTE